MRIRGSLCVTILALGVLSAACGSSYNSPTTPTDPTPNPNPAPGTSMSVSIVRGAETFTTTAYTPNPDTISVGDTLTWTNNDTVAHTSNGDDSSWASGNLAPGATYKRTFSTPGTFTYHCAIHPNMVGTVTVR